MGVYDYWDGEGGAREQVDGFKNGRYKRFGTLHEALVFIETHKDK